MSEATAEAPNTGTRATEYGQWLSRGREHHQAGRLIDALLCYRRALGANAYAVQARYRLGEILRELGRDDEARAVWRSGVMLQPGHVPLQLSLAGAARRAGAYDEAMEIYQDVLARRPEHKGARFGLVMSRIARGDEAAYGDLEEVFDEVVKGRRWADLTRDLEGAAASASRRAFLAELASKRDIELPSKLLVFMAEDMVEAGDRARASDLLARAERTVPPVEDADVLRRLARVSASIGASHPWAEQYALVCSAEPTVGAPLAWPRRTAGESLRVAFLIPSDRIAIHGFSIAPEDYLSGVVARLPQ